ncbi:MAG TPA: universal stress protein [Steroidobacteraceae bacterium]|nr:universal stress protein [Steroidobacteraceae bacterium]
MYQRILVPVDGSDVSANGLREAMRLARDQNARLRLIHVVNELMIVASYEGTIYSNELIQTLRDSGQKVLDRAAEKVKAAGLQVETALLEAHGGHAGDVIVKDAQEWPADVIVLGTHGRRGMARLVMGSDAEQVVRQATMPVLLVKTQLKS